MRLYFEALLCEVIETALNHLLRLDPSSQKLLEPLAGKTVRIKLDPPGLSFILAPTERGIFVLTDAHHGRGAEPALRKARSRESDVTLRGSPLGFLRLLLSPHGELFRGAVELEGAPEVAQKFGRLVRHLKIDWEGLLGEEPAGRLSALFRWQRETWMAFQRDLADYLQEETRALPHRLEFEDFAGGWVGSVMMSSDLRFA